MAAIPFKAFETVDIVLAKDIVLGRGYGKFLAGTPGKACYRPNGTLIEGDRNFDDPSGWRGQYPGTRQGMPLTVSTVRVKFTPGHCTASSAVDFA